MCVSDLSSRSIRIEHGPTSGQECQGELLQHPDYQLLEIIKLNCTFEKNFNYLFIEHLGI